MPFSSILTTETSLHPDQPGGGEDELGFYVHGLAEFFSTLTSGRKAFRLASQQAAEILSP